jgi:hypothetical protein
MPLTTGTADSVYLKNVRSDSAAGAVSKIIGKSVQSALFNIFDPPARFTDKVVMMFLIGTEEVILFAVGLEDPGDHPGFSKFVEDAIDRREPNTAQTRFDAAPDFIG